MFNYPQIDPVAISLGPINIHWYAISYLLGFYVCWRVLLSLRDRQRQSWRREQISDLLSYGVFGVILGGRFGLCFVLWVRQLFAGSDLAA